MKLLQISFGMALGLILAGCGRSSATMQARIPDPTEGNIAKLLARILEQVHYSQRPFDNEVSGMFLERYLESLDGQHLNFLQSDLEEFEPYRATLDELTKAGNTAPAHLIFARYLHRLEQQVAFATASLQTTDFEFTGHDRYSLNRDDLPWPKNLEAARDLWRQRLRYDYLQEKLDNKTPAEIIATLTKRYTGHLRRMREFDRSQVAQVYLDALANVYDPHSDYLGQAQFEDFSISMKLSLVGIGAELTADEGYPKISRILPGPAARKGLKPGDRIIAVAQKDKEAIDVVDMPLPKVIELVRGPRGSPVRLTILPAEATDPSMRRTVMLVREEIKLEDQEAKARLIERPDDQGRVFRLGIIDLPSFYEEMERARKSHRKSMTDDVAQLLQRLKQENVGGIILDLRRNGGGSLEEAINFTGLFVRKGPVVQIKNSGGKIHVESDKNPAVLYDGPLMVLTSRFSASASEIVAGALQDYGRALIVGDSSTFGKGTVQSVMEMGPLMKRVGLAHRSDPGAIIMTVQKFYRPSGASTQLKGVVPDIVVPSLSDGTPVGEASLDNPLPWDSIRPATFEKLGRVQPCLEELRKRSRHRVQTEEGFADLREEMGRLKEGLAGKGISLNEAERRQEKAAAEARAAVRKNHNLARRAPGEKTFEITLQNLHAPVLLAATSNNDTSAQTQPRPEEIDENESFAFENNGAGEVTLEEAQRILIDFISLSNTRRAPVAQAGGGPNH